MKRTLLTAFAVGWMLASSDLQAEEQDAATESTGATSEADAPAEPTPEIVVEAELPEGFPEPGPAGEVTLKQFPAYRAATADGANAFWKLFGHIQREGIAMTTPVEMRMQGEIESEDGDAEPDLTMDATSAGRENLAMSFLYVDPQLGQTGPDDNDASVTVEDHQPIAVLSYGFFGDPTPQRLADARTHLEQSLAERSEFVSGGPPRLLGYNSPMVPRDRRYYELQWPLQPSDAEDAVEQSATDGDTEATSP